MSSKLWGGCFSQEMDSDVLAFTTSIHVDARLWQVDITASLAHVEMLGAAGILPAVEAEEIARGLLSVRKDIETGVSELRHDAEDVHSEIERLLKEKIGGVAGKLHTARSRNDQVATDTRLYLRGQIQELQTDIAHLQKWICDTAELHLETVMPGYTHMQHAQPVSLAHHLLAYFWMLARDQERLSSCLHRINVLPLGSAALAGTSFPLKRQMVAERLGFLQVSANSLDAVSDRDFVVEFLADASLVMMHLSRLAEEIVLWSGPEFGFIQLDDSVTTGSSIMPQKKNPDVAELIRGRVGRVYAALNGSLTMLKALPLSYNRDLQEDKVFLFDGLDTTRACVRMMYKMLATARFRSETMSQALAGDFSNATDLADALAAAGLPFREAHEVAGRVVKYCVDQGRALETLTLPELREFSGQFSDDIVSKLQHKEVMQARVSQGGTAPVAVGDQLALARSNLHLWRRLHAEC